MNTKSLSIAIAIAVGSVFSLPTAHAADTIVTLDTVLVRPSADQLAQRERELNSDIPTLATVEVRPSAEQRAELEAERSATSHIVTLAAVEVRPSPEQWAEVLGADALAAENAGYGYFSEARNAIVTLLGQTMVQLPLPRLQPEVGELLSAQLADLGEAAFH